MAGWFLVGTALALMGYLVVALTVGAGFESDLQAAADREGVALNAVATATQAQVTHDHALYAALTAVFLFVPPTLLLVAVVRIRRAVGGATASWAWSTALAAALVWWAYVALGLGLFADPDDLPPLVRDFGPLTVPMVTASSLLALLAVALAAEAARGIVPRSGRATTVVCAVLGVLGVVGLVTSGYADPVPPLVVVPGALVLGVALVRAGRRASGATHALSGAVGRPG